MSTINAITSPAPAIVTTVDSTGNLILQTAGTNAVTYDANQNATHTGYISAPNTFGFKNRIINGDMRIDQRNSGSATSGASNVYMVDRFLIQGSQTGKFNYQQMNSANTSAPNYEASSAPTGFTNSIKITVGTPVTVGSSDYFIVRQPIEGNNVADFGYGTSAAQTATLSFWVKSSLTGLHSGHLANASSNRWYTFTYTINAVNTWQYISVTIPGDITGTWNRDNQMGIYVGWSLGTGASNQTSAGAWTTSTGIGVTGEVNTVATSGATWYITGAQLEVGSKATPFDYRDYGRELMMCQRYFYTESVLPPSSYDAWNIYNGGSNSIRPSKFIPTMRIAPTVTFSSTSTFQYYNGSWNNITPVVYATGPNLVGIYIGAQVSPGTLVQLSSGTCNFLASAEL
jgi:hypothetical protein